MNEIFVILPFTPEFDDVYSLIQDVVSSVDAKVFREHDTAFTTTKTFNKTISSTDLIIGDITDANPNVMFELGIAYALGKPVLLISQRLESIPFDIRGARILMYENSLGGSRQFRMRLKEAIVNAIENPELYSGYSKTEIKKNVFISYSHKDTFFLDRLLIHLQPLEKEGLIDLWADTKIKAGDKWKDEIGNALKQARVAILLISADFLASQFITNNELPPLLEKAETEGTRIIPVILKPCRFTRDKNLSVFQSINSPSSPLIMLSEGEQEQLYDRIAEIIESFMVTSIKSG